MMWHFTCSKCNWSWDDATPKSKCPWCKEKDRDEQWGDPMEYSIHPFAAEPDTSDIPEVGEDFFKKAKLCKKHSS